MTKVNIDITTWHNGDAEEGDGPWLDRGTTSGHVDKVYISNNDYNYGYRGMETDLHPPFFVVYADYTTGDTFGSDYEACIVGIVKTEEEADALAFEARERRGSGSLSNGFYVPWIGYFESLQGIYTERIA
jgi:hypothetical protein